VTHRADDSSPSRQPRRVLVTGGAGFIGSHLARLLVARGDHVTVVDNLSTGRRINLPDEACPRLAFIRADLADALAGFGPADTFDQIYHLAAAVGVKLILADPIGAIDTNVHQTSALLRFAVTHGPRGAPAPTLIASSSEVYGKSASVPFAEDNDVVYGPTTMPRWSYAMSKALDEYLALAYHGTRDLPVVVARFFNTVGPGQVGDYGMVLPRFIGAALAGEPIEVYGDGEQTRCFCDVRDCTRALPELIESPGAAGTVFNVGADTPLSMNDLASAVIRVTGSKSSLRHLRYTEAYGPGFEDLRHRKPDLTRLRRCIGFSPAIPLDQTIADVAAWIRSGRGAAADWSTLLHAGTAPETRP
jgi:UDP-glucose 4-epimerase